MSDDLEFCPANAPLRIGALAWFNPQYAEHNAGVAKEKVSELFGGPFQFTLHNLHDCGTIDKLRALLQEVAQDGYHVIVVDDITALPGSMTANFIETCVCAGAKVVCWNAGLLRRTPA